MSIYGYSFPRREDFDTEEEYQYAVDLYYEAEDARAEEYVEECIASRHNNN